MQERFQRTQMLLGEGAMERLREARVAVFGIGGVGGYVAEGLARSGVGQLDLIDSDRVAESNINRQIIALSGTVGKYKTDVMKERILEINPEAKVRVYHCFFLPENKELFDFGSYSYIADAVDTVSAKIALAMEGEAFGVPVISCMGAGNKLNPAAFEVTDIYQTSVCPLAKVMRRELRKRGIRQLKVVYSKEEPLNGEIIKGEIIKGEIIKGEITDGGAVRQEGSARRSIPGSVAFVPSVAGLIMAGEIVKDLAGNRARTGTA